MDHDWSELESLYARYRAGDLGALADLHRLMVGRLVRALAGHRNRGLSTWEIQDACHDAFVETMRRAARILHVRQASSYMTKTALSLLGKRRRRLPKDKDVMALSDSGSQPLDSESAAPFSEIELRDDIEAFTRTLGPDEAEILHSVVEMSPEPKVLAGELNKAVAWVLEKRRALMKRLARWLGYEPDRKRGREEERKRGAAERKSENSKKSRRSPPKSGF